PTLSRTSCLCNSSPPPQPQPKRAFRVLPNVFFFKRRDILCFAALIARRDPDLIAQIINPPIWNVAKIVEKKKRPIQGLGISKSTTPTERQPTMRVRVRV
ncbi:hypothetical protein LY76DRAFT_658566, partial [Colletotrichum caudatum]